jgi:hypothetical protein
VDGEEGFDGGRMTTPNDSRSACFLLAILIAVLLFHWGHL